MLKAAIWVLGFCASVILIVHAAACEKKEAGFGFCNSPPGDNCYQMSVDTCSGTARSPELGIFACNDADSENNTYCQDAQCETAPCYIEEPCEVATVDGMEYCHPDYDRGTKINSAIKATYNC